MNDASNVLTQLSAALEKQTAVLSKSVAAIRSSKGRSISALIWQSDLLVTSEQSLPRDGEVEVVKGTERRSARLVGRDPQTNIALLKLETPFEAGQPVAREARQGRIVLALGSTAEGHSTVRQGLVRLVGPEWFSQAGGRLDSFVMLDIRLSRHEEGGPVFDTDGGMIGMSTFGPRHRVLVIPTSTIARIVPQLLSGGIKQGWIGVKLQRVAIPDALVDPAGQRSGLMIMSLVQGAPADKSGLLPGDIILSIDGASTRFPREIAFRFGAESIGRVAEIKVVRGGSILSVQAAIGERPSDE
jgi:S1-C subfamily serine protease